MSAPLIILQPDNAGGMARVHAEAFPRPWPAAEFRKLLSSENASTLALGIRRGRGLAAFCIVQIAADEADLLTLAVGKRHRRKGYGRLLLQSCLKRLGERGLARMTLDVAEDNIAARALYRTLGFGEDGRRTGYYSRPGEAAVDAILMSRPVTGLAGLEPA